MEKKIFCVIVLMLLMFATILPVAGLITNNIINKTMAINCQEEPTPYITIPGNDGLLNDCGSWQTIVISNNTLIRAVDLSNKADIMFTSFEYSPLFSDYIEWITIGVDEYGGFEGLYLEGGEDIKVGNEGWSVEWDLSNLDEGYYYIRATMVDVFERSGSDTKLVYYNPTPPIPKFISLDPYKKLNGTYPIIVTILDEDIVSYELGIWTVAPPLDYYQKDNLGNEKQSNVGPKGRDGINRYCVPTAIKNSLHRFVHNGDTNLEPPLPWYPARNSPLNFSDNRYVIPAGGDADLAMARMLSEELGTTPDHGTNSIRRFDFTSIYYTDSITSGIRSYLNKRGVGCSNPNGYTVTTYGTVYTLTSDNRLHPISTNVNYNTYESELRKCEDVILDIHRWFAGADGQLGTNDDFIGGGHGVTGRSSNACPNLGDNSNDIDFVDPSGGTVVNSKWKDYNGFPGVEYGGQTWLVSGMWSISPKQRANNEYMSIGLDNSVSDGWVINWDTTTVEDGFYVITATLKDSKGFCGRANMMIEIDNIVNTPPEKPICSYDKKNDELRVTSTDADGDQIRYGVSWNNNQSVDKWTTYHNSGVQVSINCEGKKGTIGVIAEDIHGDQSKWVSVTSKEKSVEYKIFNSLFDRLFYRFPFLL